MIHLLGLLLGAAHAPIAEARHGRQDDGGDDAVWFPPAFDDYRQMPSEPDYLTVACPRCRAPIDKPCDPRTLGGHSEHRARVDAAYAVRRAGR